jgi:hypothetical protein
VEAVEVGNGRARGVRLRGGEPDGTRAGVDGGLPHGSIPWTPAVKTPGD